MRRTKQKKLGVNEKRSAKKEKGLLVEKDDGKRKTRGRSRGRRDLKEG